MLSIHAVRSIKASRTDDADWIELTFEGYAGESVDICIYFWHGSADSTWSSRFAAALEAAIDALPPTPPAAGLDPEESINSSEDE